MSLDTYQPNKGIMQKYDTLRELGLCCHAVGDTRRAEQYLERAEKLLNELMEINRKIEIETQQAAGGTE